MKVLSVVCARAGSKGFKDKCINEIGSKMVIEYSIDYSLSLGDCVKTVVSTDIDMVIEYCRKKGIEYIRRGPKLCSDDARIEDVLVDAIEKKGKDCDYCSLVYGSMPTRYVKVFNKALAFLKEHKNYDALITMQKVEKFHPEWMFEYAEENIPARKQTHYRRQELPQMMINDAHTLIFKTEPFYKKCKGSMPYEEKHSYSIFGDRIKPLFTDEVMIDIDTEKDFELAKAVILNPD